MKKLIVAALGIIAAAIGVGFSLDPGGFAGNLLAEVAGLLLGVLLAVFIVDVLVERDRAKRWDLVASETETNLRLAITRAGLDIYLMLPAPRPPPADPYTMSQASSDGLSRSLAALADLVRDAEIFRNKTEVVKVLQPHITLIRTAVMPRLIAIGEHDLVARLASLEGAFQELEHSAWLADRFGGWNRVALDIASVIDALAAVATLTENPEAASAEG